MNTTRLAQLFHIGRSVPNLDAAVAFCAEVLGLYVVMASSEAIEDDSGIGAMCTDVFGPGWGSLMVAHLSTAGGIGIEIFECPGNYAPDGKLDHKRHGTFHFAVQDPDIEGLAARIVAADGRQWMPLREYYPGKKPYRMVYVEDPFGIVFALWSHGYELTYSAGAYA